MPAATWVSANLPLYRRWISANAVGELVGLGATFAAVAVLQGTLGEASSAAGLAAGLAAFVACGAIEATAVASCQHWAMAPWFPGIRFRAWWLATLVGALLAYVLGYLPSTLSSATELAGGAAAQEPPLAVVLLLASGLGAVAGALLASAQWWVLRAHVRAAARWVPANMAAWALGMPLLFLGMELAFRREDVAHTLALVAVALVLAGGTVGAVHGRVLAGFAPPGADT